MSDTLRVLHSVGSFLPRTENWIYPQVTAVPGVDSAIFCTCTLNLAEFPLNNHPLFVRQSPLWRSAPNMSIPERAIRRIANKAAHHVAHFQAKRWRPSIVHAHFGTQGWRSLGLARSLGAALITSFYGYDAWLLPKACPKWRPRLTELFTQGDLFLVEGPALGQRLIDLGCPPEKIQIQRLGVDLGRLPNSQRTFTDTMKITMVGRFVEKKGLPEGLTACLLAARRGANLEVTIIGDASPQDAGEQEIKRRLLSLAAAPALFGHVSFTGFISQSEMLEVLKQQNILLCPSKHAANGDAEGGMPFVLAEAMAMGLIGIGSRHCDIEELIADGQTGYLFGEGDVDALAELLSSLPRMADRAAEITGAARRHVEMNFNLSKQLAVLGEIYRDCAERRRSRSIAA